MAARRPEDWTEKQFDAYVFQPSRRGLAPGLGWATYHTLRSKGSKAGYPDRTCWRERVIFAELKAEKGKPTDLQRETLTGLANAGAEVYLWRPSDLEEIGRVLGHRYDFAAATLTRRAEVGPPWTPGSLWLPAGMTAGMRADEV